MEDIISFESEKEWEAWIAKNHELSKGVWILVFKKDSGVKSVTIQQALDTALCYGWITGQSKPYDEKSWLARFVPRRPKSSWSKINTMHAERLIKEGRMQPEGLREIERAKADGRWHTAYSPPSTAKVPPNFLKALNKNKKAKEFFKTLNRANLYSIAYRLETAKKVETQKKRIKNIIEMLAKGEKFH